MTTTLAITTDRIVTGQFKVLADGQSTPYQIINGDVGCSGRGGNRYGIKNIETGKTVWVGSLALCKKTVATWIKRAAR